MRIMLATIIALAAGTVSARANCLNEMALPGVIAKGQTVERYFTLSKPGAIIGVITDSINDRLYFSAIRPSRKAACNLRGPGAILTCNPTITKKSQEGKYKVYITNKMRRSVGYTFSCSNPP